MNAYLNNFEKSTARQENLGRKIRRVHSYGLADFLASILAILTCPAAVKIEKALACTVGFFAILGVVGAMEVGIINLLAGLLICVVLAIASLLILRSLAKSR